MLTNVKKKGAANGDMPKWNKMNGRAFGLTRSMIPSSSWKVLEVLHREGNLLIACMSISAAITLISFVLTRKFVLLVN